MTKRIVLVFFAFAAFAAAQEAPTRERINQLGNGRYAAADDQDVCKGVTFSQPDYKFESRLTDGYARGTAQELGLTGQVVCNDYQAHGAVAVVLASDAIIRYDAASREPLYVVGCIREGRPGMNRIKRIPPPPPEVPPTGEVCVNKVQLNTQGGPLVDPSGVPLPVETFTFHLAGQTGYNDKNGHVCFQNVPVGTQKLTEDYDHAKWRNISETPGEVMVEVRAGEMTVVEMKNMNITGTPTPAPTVCGCEITSASFVSGFTATSTCTGATAADLSVGDNHVSLDFNEGQMSIAATAYTSGLSSGSYDFTLRVKRGEEVVATCPARGDYFAPTVSTPPQPLQLFSQITYEEEAGFCQEPHNIGIKVLTVPYCHPKATIGTIIVAGAVACYVGGRFYDWGPCKTLFTHGVDLVKPAGPGAGFGFSR